MNDAWETFLTPDTLKSNLKVASIYIAAYELLKNSIVERPRTLFTNAIGANGPKVGPEYNSEVLSRNRSLVYASLDWLKEMHAIDDNDLAEFERVKDRRNEFAHDLLTMLCTGVPPDTAERFDDLCRLLAKIERWWILNVDVATDPDYEGVEVNPDDVMPGPVIGLRIMTEVALGTDEESTK